MKEVSNQQITEHLKRLNGWWTSGTIDSDTASMARRAYVDPVAELLAEPRLRRAVVLLGPRRVGKTVLIKHLIARLLADGTPPRQIAYAEMDHPLLHGQSLERLIQLMDTAASGTDTTADRFLFFDEIQSHKDWEKHLKPLVDHHPNLHILVSGSAAAALKRQSTESGAGRFTDFLLPPLTFTEYLRLSTERAAMHATEPGVYELESMDQLNSQFVDYVNFGGYPELALSPAVRTNPERFVKSDIVDKVLLRDLPQLYGIGDIQELNALFTLLAFNTGEEIALEPLSQRSGIGKPTIRRYIEYLEAAFLIQRVFRVDQDGRRYQRNRSFKIYLTNPAMHTGLFGPRTAEDKDFGRLVETALFGQRFHENTRLNYARWGKADNEVDMIELSAALQPAVATEIKWSDRYTSHPENLSGLMQFAHKNPSIDIWATTRSQFARHQLAGTELRQWPAAALAYHYGARAVQTRLATYQAKVNGITDS